MTNIVIQLPDDLDEKVAARLEATLERAVERSAREMPPVESPPLEEFITPEEYAQAIGGRLKVSTIRAYIREGKIPGIVEHGVAMVNRKKVLENWRGRREGKT